jgi:hypothetical protein
MEFLFNSAVRLHDIRAFSTLGWAIVGLLLSPHVSLNRWCQHRPGAAQAESKVRQLMRWLHNAKIEVVQIYRPLIRTALLNYAGERLVLALDTSVLWDRFVIIRISLIYRGRAVPRPPARSCRAEVRNTPPHRKIQARHHRGAAD